MIYRFRPAERSEGKAKSGSQKKRQLRARRGRGSLRPLPPVPDARVQRERISFFSLFDFKSLSPESKRYRRKKRRDSFFSALKKILRIALTVLLLPLIPIKKWLEANKQPASPKMIFGGLMGVATATLTAVTVTVLALFSEYFGSYTALPVPDLIGKNVISDSSEVRLDERFDLAIDYEYSETFPAGTVMTQSPAPNVERKFYKNGAPCVISLTVSRGREYYSLDDLTGMSERDAELLLKNAGVAVSVSYRYSDDRAQNTVISTSPSAGEKIYGGDRVEILVSLGKQINYVSLPDLQGLTEAEAAQRLSSLGLVLGHVTYATSEKSAGVVLSQSHSPRSELPEGTRIDLTVSAGYAFTPKKIPDLYGMTLDEARDALSALGLSIGSAYSVDSGLPSGRICAQSPLPDTNISPDTVSVDVYISY